MTHEMENPNIVTKSMRQNDFVASKTEYLVTVKEADII